MNNILEVKRARRRIEFVLGHILTGRYSAALRKKGRGIKYRKARAALGLPEKKYNYKRFSTRQKESQTP